jgi:glycosyltransferase involved in cell wall biosynthesis
VADTGQDFAAAIVRLAGDPTERKRLELRARRTAEEKYSWDSIAKLQAQLYENLRPTTA